MCVFVSFNNTARPILQFPLTIVPAHNLPWQFSENDVTDLFDFVDTNHNKELELREWVTFMQVRGRGVQCLWMMRALQEGSMGGFNGRVSKTACHAAHSSTSANVGAARGACGLGALAHISCADEDLRVVGRSGLGKTQPLPCVSTAFVLRQCLFCGLLAAEGMVSPCGQGRQRVHLCRRDAGHALAVRRRAGRVVSAKRPSGSTVSLCSPGSVGHTRPLGAHRDTELVLVALDTDGDGMISLEVPRPWPWPPKPPHALALSLFM